MDDNTEVSLKQICCTCLSENRRLVQLCKVKDGVNDLYLLLSSSPEAYKEVFYRDSASLSMCWECRAVMMRIGTFRRQASVAQAQLTAIVDGRTELKTISCLSRLSNHHKSSYDITFVSSSRTAINISHNQDEEEKNIDRKFSQRISDTHNIKDNAVISSGSSNNYNYIFKSGTTCNDNFINCDTNDHCSMSVNNFAVDVDIKSECDDEDVPLSELNVDVFGDNDSCPSNEKLQKTETERTQKLLKINVARKERRKFHKNNKMRMKERMPKTKNDKSSTGDKNYYNIKVMNENVMNDSMEKRKLAVNYLDAQFKCESCIEIFKGQTDLDNHISILHTEKPKHIQCEICLCYVPSSSHKEHRNMHYMVYLCQFCEYVAYCLNDIVKHLKNGHSIKTVAAVKWRKGLRKTPKVMNPGSKPRMNPVMRDKRTPFGYQCTDCTKYFDTKRQRWMHVMRSHKEGFRCSFCGKRFAFKYNLIKHERLHSAPLPRQECPICHKSIRVDLAKTHAATHSNRDAHTCVACGKTFASRASYYHHLKYTRAHAAIDDILKYKCSQCEKGYRSRAELRDHENYQHKGETQHKCPICEKALATVRCVRRHVKRAHEGIKENRKDKICQQCGKAFRDKKTLREHELTHTGERPLTCSECGNTFRQYASLYTHRKRVHKIQAARKQIRQVGTVTGKIGTAAGQIETASG